MGWYEDNSSSAPQPAMGKAANAWGLHDMSGNVWELVWDCCDSSSYGGPSTDPAGPACSIQGDRSMRGGAFGFPSSDAPVTLRNFYGPGFRWEGIGFRVARTAP